MANDRHNEPQSYGSQESERGDFYNPGGSVSPKEIGRNHRPASRADEDDEPTQKITSLPAGAKRDSYFKRRDYE